MKKILLQTACLFGMIFHSGFISSQNIAPAILQKNWYASWITVPGAPPNGYGVYLFRKSIELASQPATFVIHVSADNRYKLFVNEKMVSLGPVRGDLQHWHYETVDIAPYLKSGKNVIAAQVWNEAEWRPEAQISLQTAFIVQGATEALNLINTNSSWKCQRDSSYTPIRVSLATYYVTGPGELVHLSKQAKNWQSLDYADADWKNAKTIFAGNPKNIQGQYGTPSGWMLIPSTLPQMEFKAERFAKVAKVQGLEIPAGFPTAKVELNIPANTIATILLDQGHLTNAYPALQFSGGKGGSISLQYAEALFSKNPNKGNRNEVEGKQMIGRKDSLFTDGSANQTFTTLNFRTYRYVQVRIITKDEALTLHDVSGNFIGYPFQLNSSLNTDNTEIQKMLEIGWRTARLCAVETYMDCPYYEQLQYIGDARCPCTTVVTNGCCARPSIRWINPGSQKG